MNPPSDVIVLSVIEPRLSLPLLLDALDSAASAFFCGFGGSTARVGGGAFAGTGGEALFDVEDDGADDSERRRSWVPEFNASEITLVTAADAVIDGGGRPPELRRGVMGSPKSICFRPGEEFDDPGGFSDSPSSSRRF